MGRQGDRVSYSNGEGKLITFYGSSEIISIMNAVTNIASAQSIFQHDRRRGEAALNEIFRAGSPPNPPLDAEYKGEFVALDVAPGLNQLIEMITSRWMPWKGKFFNKADSGGDNIFTRDSSFLAHIFWRLYRGHKMKDNSIRFR